MSYLETIGKNAKKAFEDLKGIKHKKIKKVLDNYKEELSDIAELESTSNPDGRSITMVLAPIGGRK